MKKVESILTPENEGRNNQNMEASIERLHKGNTYKNLSTVWITPTRGSISPRVVTNWMGLMKPMNQPVVGPIFLENEEVGVAYQKAFEMVLENPELSKFKYILTVEEDNLPPADGLLKLYENIEDYDCIGGLYWVKGEHGQPMIYGNVNEKPMNFVPQSPIPDSIQPCNGLGMGFNLWRIDSFRKKLKNMPRPWFKTVQEIGRGFTQDLYFFHEASKYGYKCACDTRIKVGHYDVNSGIVW